MFPRPFADLASSFTLTAEQRPSFHTCLYDRGLQCSVWQVCFTFRLEMAADQFCLRWNNFQVNITSALESLKSDEDLVDVTLTCEGQNVKAHKVILSACSPYFRNVFKENPCQHPVVILKDVKYEDVTALINFMYHGEVYITQDRLAPFLHTAELLQVRGLTGAANPLKDLQTQSPILQSKSCQQQVKVKKSSVSSQSGQMCRVTPPLSVSPSVRPLITPVKILQAPRTSLVSSPFEDPSANVASPIAKDPLCHEPELDLPPKSVSPVSMPLQVPQLSVNFSTSKDQAGPSYSSLNLEQTTAVSPPPQNSAAFQLPNSDSNIQMLSPRFENSSRGQSLTQPSSPPGTKRRKTVPRRFSNNPLSSDQTESPLNTNESTKILLQDSKEPVEEKAFEDVSVKMEDHSGDEIYNDQDEEDSSAYLPENLTDTESAEFAKQKNDSFDHQLREEEEMMAEVERGDARTLPSNQSMLLRSLSGKPHGFSQSDGANSIHCYGDELETTQSWGENERTINMHFVSENLEDQPTHSSRFLEMQNCNVHLEDISQSSVTHFQQTVMSNSCARKYMNEDSRNNQPYRQRNRMLYHRRKHSWNSRRPVQCPNCNKIISMAYNLKSHLISCMKRFGVVGSSANA